MKHGSLFTGLEGFGLAAEWMGWENVFQVENNEWCANQLKRNFPNVKKYADIREFSGKEYAGRIDILTGGFPCQTFSVAGKGALDLTLWKEMYRVITEIKPPYVVAENVPGIVSRKRGMAFHSVCADLEIAGYEVLPLNIPVAGKGAPHERERIWFVAYSDRFRCENEQEENGQTLRDKKRNGKTTKQKGSIEQRGTGKPDSNTSNAQSVHVQRFDTQQGKGKSGRSHGRVSINATNTNGKRPQGQGKLRGQLHSEQGEERQINRTFNENQFEENWTEVAARLCGMDDGVPNRVDKLIALGNAVSPIIPFQIFKAIEQTKKELHEKII